MCQFHSLTLEPAPAVTPGPEAFTERLLGAFNDTSLVLMLSIGRRTGLLDALADGEWRDSAQAAAAAGLQERYVREWLAAMATARICEMDDRGRYRLPPDRAAVLSGENDNLSIVAQYFAVLGSVEDDLVDCFRRGGGVPYERYTRFHDVMAEDSSQTVVAALDEHILPLVPGLAERLADGIEVVDLGCGSGRALAHLARRFPRSRFVGYDLSPQAVERARRAAADLDNVRFEIRDLADFDRKAEPAAFDLATTFDAVHDQPKPAALLRGIRRTLRPDGVYLMQDIDASSRVEENLDHPVGTMLYSISCMHCMTVSLAQGGDGLGTMWGREAALGLLAEAGFANIEVHKLDHDLMNAYYVARV